jgi:hypothetical protein
MKHRSLQPSEHLGAGIVLAEAERAITTIVMALHGARHCDKAIKLLNRLQAFKSYMDDQACAEDLGSHETDGVLSIEVYYGWWLGPDRLREQPMSNQKAREILTARANEAKARLRQRVP